VTKGHNQHLIARTYRVKGRVQGVGFRYFVQHNAEALGVRGYVRNEDDGSVFVYAVGHPDAISRLAGAIHTGPRFSEVRHVEEQEAAIEKHNSFQIES
jgi:acylphosphatase